MRLSNYDRFRYTPIRVQHLYVIYTPGIFRVGGPNISAPGPDISDNNLIDWDTWLTPEALYDKKYLATSQYSFINIGDCTERQYLLKYTPQLYSNGPEVPLLSDRSLQLTQSTDSNKETITIGLQTLSPGVYTFTKRRNTEIQPIVINEKE
ncbi:uncharacterized protein N7479_009443 [Penicillium vulpinum]|uniref:uncharacterized protein n=1 Tax=Penicillium vulpinum TaxID=29845 RepID=UPI0025497A26|nr:uncharacterized protein N7479_009443 [Penicillium vulpinum]KAJ5951030.1 hypothetical protein N7479_009443 [Penicillium vulpinum]